MQEIIGLLQNYTLLMIKKFFEILEKDKDKIEKEFGEKFLWEPLPHRVASRIKIVKEKSFFEKEEKWDEYVEWLIEKLEKIYFVFNKRLKNLE